MLCATGFSWKAVVSAKVIKLLAEVYTVYFAIKIISYFFIIYICGIYQEQTLFA
jgi:hypothetical protein